jgi:hypothetical protein
MGRLPWNLMMTSSCSFPESKLICIMPEHVWTCFGQHIYALRFPIYKPSRCARTPTTNNGLRQNRLNGFQLWGIADDWKQNSQSMFTRRAGYALLRRIDKHNSFVQMVSAKSRISGSHRGGVGLVSLWRNRIVQGEHRGSRRATWAEWCGEAVRASTTLQLTRSIRSSVPNDVSRCVLFWSWRGLVWRALYRTRSSGRLMHTH